MFVTDILLLLLWKTLNPELVVLSTFSSDFLSLSDSSFTPSCTVVWAGKPSWSQHDANETIIKDFFLVLEAIFIEKSYAVSVQLLEE